MKITKDSEILRSDDKLLRCTIFQVAVATRSPRSLGEMENILNIWHKYEMSPRVIWNLSLYQKTFNESSSLHFPQVHKEQAGKGIF